MLAVCKTYAVWSAAAAAGTTHDDDDAINVAGVAVWMARVRRG